METSFSASQTFCVMSLVERKQHNIAYYRNDSVHSLFTSERRVRANQISTTGQFENPTCLNIFLSVGSKPACVPTLILKVLCIENECVTPATTYVLFIINFHVIFLVCVCCYAIYWGKLCCLSSNSWFCMYYVLDCSIESAPN